MIYFSGEMNLTDYRTKVVACDQPDEPAAPVKNDLKVCPNVGQDYFDGSFLNCHNKHTDKKNYY